MPTISQRFRLRRDQNGLLREERCVARAGREQIEALHDAESHVVDALTRSIDVGQLLLLVR